MLTVPDLSEQKNVILIRTYIDLYCQQKRQGIKVDHFKVQEKLNKQLVNFNFDPGVVQIKTDAIYALIMDKT